MLLTCHKSSADLQSTTPIAVNDSYRNFVVCRRNVCRFDLVWMMLLQKAVDIAVGMRNLSVISDLLQVLLYRRYCIFIYLFIVCA